MSEKYIVHPDAEKYISQFTSSQDVLLQQVIHKTTANHKHSHMLSGREQGVLLQMISHMIKPKNVLEIGTFTGFSALCLAAGLQPGGALHTIELREEDAAEAKRNFDKSIFRDHIYLHCGDAKEIIPAISREWDLVFIDADKVGYIDYYELTLPQLKSGGFILADNVLFHGEVFTAAVTGKNAKAIHAFNRHVAADDRTEQVILSVRDGITLIRKL